MNIESLAAIINIGELALQHHKALHEVDWARIVYHDKLREGGFECRPDRYAEHGTEAHEAVEYTKQEFAELKSRQRIAYNIKRRLQTACRNYGKE